MKMSQRLQMLLRHQAATILRHLSGYLRLSGEDRIAFLQRQTTNDLHLAQPGAPS